MNNTILSSPFQYFIGIDVGKDSLVLCRHGETKCSHYPNSPEGIADIISFCATLGGNGYGVVDTTGGWERLLIAALLQAGLSVHRADGRKVNPLHALWVSSLKQTPWMRLS